MARWIQAIGMKKGAFTAKAKAAGMGTQAYARQVTAEGSRASTQTKRQANLAKTLSRLSKRKKRRRGGAVARALA